MCLQSIWNSTLTQFYLSNQSPVILILCIYAHTEHPTHVERLVIGEHKKEVHLPEEVVFPLLTYCLSLPTWDRCVMSTTTLVTLAYSEHQGRGPSCKHCIAICCISPPVAHVTTVQWAGGGACTHHYSAMGQGVGRAPSSARSTDCPVDTCDPSGLEGSTTGWSACSETCSCLCFSPGRTRLSMFWAPTRASGAVTLMDSSDGQ